MNKFLLGIKLKDFLVRCIIWNQEGYCLGFDSVNMKRFLNFQNRWRRSRTRWRLMWSAISTPGLHTRSLNSLLIWSKINCFVVYCILCYAGSMVRRSRRSGYWSRGSCCVRRRMRFVCCFPRNSALFSKYSWGLGQGILRILCYSTASLRAWPKKLPRNLVTGLQVEEELPRNLPEMMFFLILIAMYIVHSLLRWLFCAESDAFTSKHGEDALAICELWLQHL